MTSSSYAGIVLDDRFELVSSLGEGGGGTVWLARDLRLGISVAVKILRSTLRMDTTQRAAFEREARLCARMLSPNIVRVLSYGVAVGDVPFIVYEHLEGETLATRIASRGPLDLHETEEVIVQVARALARAHSMDVVHKDIKPANVFLTSDERNQLVVKVLDFGIAEIAGQTLLAPDEICGTLEYMAPEVLFEGQQGDARADLYALTVLAYECLTGVVPHPGDTVTQLLRSLRCGAASMDARFDEPDASRALDAFIEKGTRPRPDDRFQSARELAIAFHDATKSAKVALGLTAPPRRSTLRSVPRIANPGSFSPVPLQAETDGEERSADSRRAIPPAAPTTRERVPSFVFEEETPSGTIPIHDDQGEPKGEVG